MTNHVPEPSAENDHPENESSGNTPRVPIGLWIEVFGSSALFHALLLALLGMLIVGQHQESEEQFQVELPPDARTFDFEKTESTVDKTPINKEVQNMKPKISEHQSERIRDDLNKETDSNQGRNKKAISEANLNANKWNVDIGISGGAGNNFGSRNGGGNQDSGPSGNSSPPTTNAVQDALLWLARHQSPDGHWDIYEYTNQCDGTVCERFVESSRTEYNVGVTGLALLAFLGAGYTHVSRNGNVGDYNFRNVVEKGLFWLKEQQNAEGAFSTGGSKPMYNNALATLAYAEAYGMTGAPKLHDIAQNGVHYLQKAQNEKPEGTGFLGWRYQANSGRNDTSVTGWAAMAIKSAELAGLDTSSASMEGALSWVKKATVPNYWYVGYREKSDAGEQVTVQGKNEHYKNHNSMTAIGMLIRMFVNQDPNSKPLKGGAEILMKDLPTWKEGAEPNEPGNPIDYYYWYYASLAMYMYAGPGSPHEDSGAWERWNNAMTGAVVDSQEGVEDGHENGSWDPISRWSWEAGRVYATAINALTLEVYYRYQNAFLIGKETDDKID